MNYQHEIFNTDISQIMDKQYNHLHLNLNKPFILVNRKPDRKWLSYIERMCSLILSICQVTEKAKMAFSGSCENWQFQDYQFWDLPRLAVLGVAKTRVANFWNCWNLPEVVQEHSS